ncbi:hypothetical protein [Rouxiella sp. Mn2063]|uniref:hypothetical protein n=1 Tax=Rouxiella sp. Mn2063 TaxID=3395262 RepID=UPI003BD02B5C
MIPSLVQVIEFVRDFSSHRRTPINEDTYLEADLGITGDDGSELLEEIAQAFGVILCTEEDGYRTTFGLQENEYLFQSEGFDLFCINRFIDWLRGVPRPIIRDLSIGQLHRALVAAYSTKADN